MAKKIEQGQKFLNNGVRIPVTKLMVNGNIVTAIKTQTKDKYSAVQLGFDKRKKISAKSNKSAYPFLKEVKTTDKDAVPSVGDLIKASEVFSPGDVVNVTGVSKGKGYAGGVKRYNFRGGPRTHGQGDRERAPGSIGATTTPGRVYKGKRMAGRMGHDKVTVKNIRIVSVNDDYILVKGLVPGGRNSILMVKKVGVDKKFVPLHSEKAEENINSAGNTKAAELRPEIKKEEEAARKPEAKKELSVDPKQKEAVTDAK